MSRALFHRLAALCPLLLACLTGALADQSQSEGGGGEKKVAEKGSDQKSEKQKSDQTPAEEILRGIRAIATEELLNAAPAKIEKWLEDGLRDKYSKVYKICFPELGSEDPKQFGDLTLSFNRADAAQIEFLKSSRDEKASQTLRNAALDTLILVTLQEMNAEAGGASAVSEEDLAKMLYCRGCCASWWSQVTKTAKEEWREFAEASFREAAEKGLLEALYMLGVCQEIDGETGSGKEADGCCADDYYAAVVFLSLAQAYLVESEESVQERQKQSEQDLVKQKRICAADQSNLICESVGLACKADTRRPKISADDIKMMLSGGFAFLVRQDEKWWKEGTKDSDQWQWRELARDSIRNRTGQPELKK